MGHISLEQFLQKEHEKQERAAKFEANGPMVGYFNLKNDGDEAVVRFAYTDPGQLDIITTHQTTVDGKFRRVNCLRDFTDPIEACPMCASGTKQDNRFYIKLIEYVREEDGSIKAVPKIWDRPTSYVSRLNNFFIEYGDDLEDVVFKVKRSGEAGSKTTDYFITLANPKIYNEAQYPKVPDAFEKYSVVGTAVLDKNFEELTEMLGGKAAPTAQEETITTTQPRKVSY